MALWLPNGVTREMDDAKKDFTAQVMGQVQEELERFNKEIRRLDPYTSLVRADPRSKHPQLRPGYYHIIRRPPDGPPMIEVWEGPNGEFKEPGSDLFEWLRHSDLWSDRTRREREKRQKQLKKLAEREREAEAYDRREELYQRIRSATRTSIAVPKGV